MDLAAHIYSIYKKADLSWAKILNSNKIKETEEQIKYSVNLFNVFQKHNDIKSALWFPMTFEQKMNLMLHETDIAEFTLQLSLLVLQHGSHRGKVDRDDERLERTLNTLIYEKFMGLCKIEAIKA